MRIGSMASLRRVLTQTLSIYHLHEILKNMADLCDTVEFNPDPQAKDALPPEANKKHYQDAAAAIRQLAEELEI